jgi:hypothetical protein
MSASMKIILWLEILAGICVFLFTLPNSYLEYVSFSKWIAEGRISSEEILTRELIFITIPAFLVACGTYFHAAKNSKIGLGLIILCGGFLIITHFLGLLVGNAFNGYRLLGISPGLFAFVTILLALCNTLLNLRSNNKTF